MEKQAIAHNLRSISILTGCLLSRKKAHRGRDAECAENTPRSLNGWFLKVEQDGWTVIAFINAESATAVLTLSAIDENGNTIASVTLPLAGGQKYVGIVAQLFLADITRARYFKFESNRQLIGFTISSSADGTMLDGLPSMPQFSRYLGRRK